MTLDLLIMSATTFAARFRAARDAAGLTQSQLAKRAGITRSAISQWETGDVTRVDALPLLACAQTLGVGLEWLLRGEGPGVGEDAASYRADDIPPDMRHDWRHLTRRQRADIAARVHRMAQHNLDLLTEIGQPPDRD